jgi:NUDIX domain
MTPELQTKGGVASAAAMRSGLADPVPVGEGAVKGWRVEKRMPAPAHPAAHAFPVSVKGVAVQGGGVLLLENERNEWELPGGKLELREEPADCVVREIRGSSSGNPAAYAACQIPPPGCRRRPHGLPRRPGWLRTCADSGPVGGGEQWPDGSQFRDRRLGLTGARQ